jgi:predicted nuclease with TOPRIM domain
MDDKKNLLIAALVALLLISAVWGQKETGRRKVLARENATLHTQLKEAGDATKAVGELQAEAAHQREARQQTAAQLENARQKINELQGKLSGLAEQEKALIAAEEAKKSLAAECDKKITTQQDQLAQQKMVLEKQEQKLSAAEQTVKACEEKAAGKEKIQADLDELDGANKQLEEERNKILTEAETLRAQVIGLEKIVEERSTALEKTSKELDNCKLNNSILITQIAGQQEPKKGGFKSKIEPTQQQPTQQPEQKPVQQPVQK